MEEQSTFDKIVRDLYDDERRDLLSRIEHAASVSNEPLAVEQEEKPATDADTAFKNLSFFQRFLIMIKSLFTGKESREIFEENLLNNIKKQITRIIPHSVDFRSSLFLEKMRHDLESLGNSARFFRKYIQPISDNNKEEFAAFLTWTECERVSMQLENETDPRQIAGSRGVRDEGELKEQMERRFREILNDFPKEEKQQIQRDYQALQVMNAFACFDFDTILARFISVGHHGGPACSFSDISKRMIELAEILKSTRTPPSKTALHALFLYSMQPAGQGNKEMEEELRNNFGKAEEALGGIRKFNREIPMAMIAKVLMNDYNYVVSGLNAGEDWFLLLKKYWSARLSKLYRNYTRELRSMNLETRIQTFLGGSKPPEIKYYHPSFYDNGPDIGHWRSLSFVAGFFRNVVLQKMSATLKILFINGEFYKSDNRIEYTDAFNTLNSLNEKIPLFEKRIHPEGEIGSAIAVLMMDTNTQPLAGKKAEVLMRKADAEALAIIDKVTGALQSITKILNGILYSDAGGKYDTIANLSYIGGKENEVLRKEWERCIAFAHEAFSILKDIRTLESSV
ncbi:MAG: hypothetical protein EHM28_01170 [Spirochaetaceae bacterium]|nr:MAG: hypothetical protein EHM28_01170 [Spirochaetaceae bacterium]